MLVHLRDGGGGVVELVATTAAAATPSLVTADNKPFELSCGSSDGGDWWQC